MILILGRGYIGTRMAEEMRSHALPFMVNDMPCSELTFDGLTSLMFDNDIDTVINCAAFIAGHQVDNNEDFKADNLLGNLLFPVKVCNACQSVGARLLHVSTACLFVGDKGGDGFTEEDEPHISFRARKDCGVYVGAKNLAEEVLREYEDVWICRVRLPFDNVDHPRNYLSKIRRYAKVVDACNSLSHRGDFVRICREIIQLNAPFGVYQVVNKGAIWTHDIVQMMGRTVEWWDNEEFARTVARTPKSNCTLSVAKLESAGIHVRPVEEAVRESLANWIPE